MPSAAYGGGPAARGGEPSTSAPQTTDRGALMRQYPCREQPIQQLIAHLTGSGSAGAPLFVHGPPATGKTAIVRDLFRALGLRHAYVNCNETSRTKPLLCAILHQLKGGKRRRDEGYDCAVRCDSISDFLEQLPGVVPRRPGAAPAWLVIDAAHRVAGTELLSALMRARGATGTNLGVVLLSPLSWATGAFLRDTVTALPCLDVHFPAYNPDQLVTIIEHRRNAAAGGAPPPDAPAFRQFLGLLVPPLSRATTNLADVGAGVAALWPKYSAPLREGRALQAAQLFHRVRGDVQRMVSELDVHRPAAAVAAAAAASAAEASGALAGGSNGGGGGDRRASSRGLAFELPFASKFLLLAAYIASRNKPTADRAVFDPTHRKRGRRNAQATDRQAEAAAAARLRGPHTFPLERLLHIFFAIYAHHDDEDEDEEEGGGGGREEGAAGPSPRRSGGGVEARREMLRGEVLMQVSTLVALRLLAQSSGDLLEGHIYRCNVPDDTAHAIADNLRLRLGDYLKLA